MYIYAKGQPISELDIHLGLALGIMIPFNQLHFLKFFLAKLLGTIDRQGNIRKQIINNVNEGETRKRKDSLSKRNVQDKDQDEYEWKWIDNDWHWLKQSHQTPEGKDLVEDQAKVSEDGQWIWLNEEWKLLSDLHPMSNKTYTNIISEDGQWIWLDTEWKLIADLNQSDRKIDQNSNLWFGKYSCYIYHQITR